MGLSNAGEWIAWGGIVLPLLAMAWSAVTFSQAKRREVKHMEYQRFFEIMDHLGQQGGSIASKMAAAFELRKYPEYTSVIVNVCEKASVDGSAAAMLKEEMAATAKYLKGVK
jgi:hypothetical protein